MYAYETMFHAGVCALADDIVVIGIIIDSTRHKVTIEIAVFIDVLVFRFISYSPFVPISAILSANKSHSPIVREKNAAILPKTMLSRIGFAEASR
jgi:hypothetical protein